MLFKNGTVFTPDGKFDQLDVLIQDGKIAKVGHNLPDAGEEVLDLTGKKLLPGFVDIHTHGCGGVDFSDGTPEAFQILADTYIKAGVTTVCPTLVTLPPDQISQVYKSYNSYMQESHAGTRLIGINMEGPFLSVAKKGAHVAEWIIPADFELFQKLNADSGNRILMIDVAPEIPGNLAFIEKAKDVCTVSVAHTNGDYNSTLEAYRAGATNTTHLFNAMTGFAHREPGVVGAVFDSDSYAELICDGIHIHPAAVRTCFKLMGDRICVISDSLMAAGLPDGTVCELGGQTVTVQNGKATLASGTIAGSVVDIHKEVVNLIRFGVDECTALKAATITPAKVVKIDHLVGSIAEGKLADLVIIDLDYNIEAVYRDGIKQTIA